jgi:hypothetical protein
MFEQLFDYVNVDLAVSPISDRPRYDIPQPRHRCTLQKTHVDGPDRRECCARGSQGWAATVGGCRRLVRTGRFPPGRPGALLAGPGVRTCPPWAGQRSAGRVIGCRAACRLDRYHPAPVPRGAHGQRQHASGRRQRPEPPQRRGLQLCRQRGLDPARYRNHLPRRPHRVFRVPGGACGGKADRLGARSGAPTSVWRRPPRANSCGSRLSTPSGHHAHCRTTSTAPIHSATTG